MQSPDFARLGPPALEHKDLLFLFEHFPTPGVSAEEAARRVIEQPNMLDLLLESRYVYEAMLDTRAAWLDVSPKLFFNVALRRSLSGRRDAAERRTIHYLANLLGLFAHADRLYRVQQDDESSYEYLADLVQAAAEAEGSRRFLVVSHIGNYALFLAGVCAPWIEHRRVFRKRPVTLDYYCNMGRSHFATASKHRLADDYGLRPVFAQLSGRFDYYRDGLDRMAARHLH
jgi:hypothetical protein